MIMSFIFTLFIYKHNFKHDVHAPLHFIFLSHIFFLINLLSLVVLLGQLYNSTAIVAILIKIIIIIIII